MTIFCRGVNVSRLRLFFPTETAVLLKLVKEAFEIWCSASCITEDPYEEE
jgi:hypothetical protein